MKHLVLLALALAACKKDPPAACTAYAKKEVVCSPDLVPSAREKVRSTSMRECTDAFETEPDDEIQRLFMQRVKHDATCADTSGTCEAYELCADAFDLKAAMEESRTSSAR